MATPRLDTTQCHKLGEALFDIGKLAFGIAVASPLVAEGIEGWRAALIGSTSVMSFFAIATRLMKEKS